MAEKVSGFLSVDGNFFKTESEADKHNAEMEIRAWCVQENVNSDKVLSILEALADPIMEFINASIKIRDNLPQEASTAEEAGDSNTDQLDQHPTDDSTTEDRSKAVFKLSNDRHEPMSNLGSRPLTTKSF